MRYARTIRAREIYGIVHIVKSLYFCGILIWRTTKPMDRYAGYR